MRIDKNKLKEYAALDDEELWRKVIEITAAYGISLPKKTPSKSELEPLRAALLDTDRFNLQTAMRLLNDYKRRNS